ncbi:MAG TPA: extracellular solute-binding protein [Chloroflexota bacterium]|jgi:ABC-type glycerol-3-phosphate transport system substrate-binding protein
MAGTLVSRRRLLRRVAGLGVGVLAVSAAAACQSIPGLSRQTTIRFWWVQQFTGVTGKEDPQTAKPTDFADWLIKGFNEKHPNVTVEREVLAFNDLRPKLNTAAAAGTGGPDIFYEAASNLRKYAFLGVLEPVDSYVTAQDLDDYYPLFIQQMTVQGKKYFWPIFTAGTALVANRRIFQELKVEDLLPKNEERTWSFEQFREATRAVTRDGRYAWGLGLADRPGDYHVHAFPWGHGAKMFSDDGARYAFNSEEAAAGIQYLADLANTEKTLVPGTAGLTWNDLTQLFLQRKVAFLAGALGTKNTVDAALKSQNIPADAIELWPLAYPSKQGVAPQHYSESGGVAVWQNKDRAVVEAAMQLGAYMTSSEIVKQTCTAAGWPPSRKSVGDIFAGEPYGQYVSRAASKWGNPDVLQLGYYDLRQVILPMYQGIISGKVEVKPALAESVQPAQQIIDKLRSGK